MRAEAVAVIAGTALVGAGCGGGTSDPQAGGRRWQACGRRAGLKGYPEFTAELIGCAPSQRRQP